MITDPIMNFYRSTLLKFNITKMTPYLKPEIQFPRPIWPNLTWQTLQRTHSLIQVKMQLTMDSAFDGKEARLGAVPQKLFFTQGLVP